MIQSLCPMLGFSFNVLLFPQQASGYARSVDILYTALLVFSLFVTLTVFWLVVYFGVRYRASSQVNRLGRITHTTPYEVSFIILFVIIGMAIFVWAAALYYHVERPPAQSTTCYVVAKQWMWKIWHPGGQEEINSLHVPAGRTIKLVMTSQDVIHSFFVPAFRAKQDVLPQQYTTLWFKADRPGTYHLYCSQYCGTEHSEMTGQVVVMSPGDYEQWLAGKGGNAIATMPGGENGRMYQAGRTAFTQHGCNACHIRTSDNRAPRLDGIFGRPIRLINGKTVIADEQYIRESILQPNAKISAGYQTPSLMPSYQGQLSEEDLAKLVTFIQSIRNGWPTPETDTPASNSTPPTDKLK
jgi:cytochrome c oxidase subunit 2